MKEGKKLHVQFSSSTKGGEECIGSNPSINEDVVEIKSHLEADDVIPSLIEDSQSESEDKTIEQKEHRAANLVGSVENDEVLFNTSKLAFTPSINREPVYKAPQERTVSVAPASTITRPNYEGR